MLRININFKIIFLIALLLFVLNGSFIFLLWENGQNNIASQKTSLLETKKEILLTTTNIVYQGIEHIYQTTENKEEAKTKIKALVKSFRYSIGNEKRNYFWIQGLNKNVIMHPVAPKLNDTYSYELKDAQGKFFIQNMIRLATEHKESFWEYYYNRPNSEIHEAKLARIKLFEPLGWIVTTGVYLDDVRELVEKEQKIIQKRITNLIIITLVITVIVLIGAG
ncbi:MAG: signal transduction histidine kinase, partial [bacterium]